MDWIVFLIPIGLAVCGVLIERILLRTPRRDVVPKIEKRPEKPLLWKDIDGWRCAVVGHDFSIKQLEVRCDDAFLTTCDLAVIGYGETPEAAYGDWLIWQRSYEKVGLVDLRFAPVGPGNGELS